MSIHSYCFGKIGTLLLLILLMNSKVVLSKIHLRVSFVSKGKMEGKIINGSSVPIEKYPYVAMVFNNGAMCAGTVLNSWSVLTAAHCFHHNKDVSEIFVHVGARHTYDYKAEIHSVDEVQEHPDFDKAMPFACDIAVVFVVRPMAFGKKVQKAVLVNHTKWMNTNETNFTVTGWGMIKYNGPLSERGLLKTNLRFVPSRVCGRLHQLTLTPDMFCLYGDGERDSCKGDSGGGVLWRQYIVGVVSHGDGCASKNRPSVYSNVWYFREWLQMTIEDYFVRNCSGLKKAKRIRIRRKHLLPLSNRLV